MNTKPLIISNSDLRKIVDIPNDAKIKSVGMTEDFNKAVIFIESKEFSPKDYGEPIESRGE